MQTVSRSFIDEWWRCISVWSWIFLTTFGNKTWSFFSSESPLGSLYPCGHIWIVTAWIFLKQFSFLKAEILSCFGAESNWRIFFLCRAVVEVWLVLGWAWFKLLFFHCRIKRKHWMHRDLLTFMSNKRFTHILAGSWNKPFCLEVSLLCPFARTKTKLRWCLHNWVNVSIIRPWARFHFCFFATIKLCAWSSSKFHRLWIDHTLQCISTWTWLKVSLLELKIFKLWTHSKSEKTQS
jgi:hypothetical protein